MKSADWAGNRPHPLGAWSAEALAELPTYYVMRRDEGMARRLRLIDGAGHWVQQEQPEAVTSALLELLDGSAS